MSGAPWRELLAGALLAGLIILLMGRPYMGW
jgi:hypothetical protein